MLVCCLEDPALMVKFAVTALNLVMLAVEIAAAALEVHTTGQSVVTMTSGCFVPTLQTVRSLLTIVRVRVPQANQISMCTVDCLWKESTDAPGTCYRQLSTRRCLLSILSRHGTNLCRTQGLKAVDCYCTHLAKT